VSLGKWIGFFALVVSLYILWKIRAIILLVFTAVILVTALNRLVRRLQKSGANRGLAIALVVGILLTFLVGSLAIISIPLADQFEQLRQLLPEWLEQLRAWLNWLQGAIPGRVVKNLPSFGDLTQQIQTLINWVIVHFYLLFSNVLTLIFNSLLIVAMTLMLLANPQQYRRALIQFFPAFYRQRADDILSECEVGLIGWLAGIALSMTFIGVTCTIGLWVLQVPLPLINGLLAGLSAFIPYLGAILSVVPPMLLALLDAPWKAGAVLLVYFLIQQIEGNFVTPLIMKKQVSLLPASTLAILTAFGVFFGFLGLFLALPILVVAQTWIKEVLIKDVLDRWQGETNL
jgi:predicted PurR-regulated permease PerM